MVEISIKFLGVMETGGHFEGLPLADVLLIKDTFLLSFKITVVHSDVI